MLPQATSDLYRAQQRRVVSTSLLLRQLWARMSDDFDASWSIVGPRAELVVASAQLSAALDGAASVPAALAQQRQSADAVARVLSSSLSGVASDGRDLASLLESSVFEAKRAVGTGRSVVQALEVGGRHLEMVAHTQIADAARDGSSLAITSRPRVMWVRMVNPPCCQRCAVLAGKVFKYNQGFKRHPRCDCVHSATTDPNARGVHVGVDDVKDLTAHQRDSIAGGADFNKVINDRQRRTGDYLPATRVDSITSKARSRESAVEALTRAGFLAA